MPLTPIDIQQKTFGPELRGYNMDEVDDFLDEVVTTLKDYDQQIRDAHDRIRALEAEVATRGEDETAISRALVAAQKQADALITDAREEADSIRDHAHDETAQFRAERDAEQMALTQEIARMRATVADLKRRIVELAVSAESDLDEMDQAAAEASDAVSGTEESPAAEARTLAKPWDVIETPTEGEEDEWPPTDVDELEEVGRYAADTEVAEPDHYDDRPEVAASENDAEHLTEELDLDDLERDYDDDERMGDHEARPSPEQPGESAAGSRRPWERGSV